MSEDENALLKARIADLRIVNATVRGHAADSDHKHLLAVRELGKLQARIAAAMNYHFPDGENGYCICQHRLPCPTVRALTGKP